MSSLNGYFGRFSSHGNRPLRSMVRSVDLFGSVLCLWSLWLTVQPPHSDAQNTAHGSWYDAVRKHTGKVTHTLISIVLYRIITGINYCLNTQTKGVLLTVRLPASDLIAITTTAVIATYVLRSRSLVLVNCIRSQPYIYQERAARR